MHPFDLYQITKDRKRVISDLLMIENDTDFICIIAKFVL